MVLTKVHRIGRVKKITEWKGSYPCSYETSGTRHHRKLTEKEITYEKATETLSHCGSGRRITVFSSAGSKRLTKAGIAMLSVFLPTIYLWLTCGTSWTSLLSVTVAVLLGTYAGANAYGTLWGNVVCAAIIPFMMVATVLEESGAFEWIVKWIISRKFIHGRPTLFMIMFTLAMIIISIFTAPQVVAVLFFKLLEDVTTSIGYTKKDGFYKS